MHGGSIIERFMKMMIVRIIALIAVVLLRVMAVLLVLDDIIFAVWRIVFG